MTILQTFPIPSPIVEMESNILKLKTENQTFRTVIVLIGAIGATIGIYILLKKFNEDAKKRK